MTKTIVLRKPPEKEKEEKPKSKYITYDKEAIKTALVDYTLINSAKKRDLLIPGKTYIRYISKEDKGLRRGGFLKQISEDYAVIYVNNKVWTLSFEKFKIYAKLTKMYEDMEKADAYDFLQELLESNTIKLQTKKSGKWVDTSWENVLKLYYKMT